MKKCAGCGISKSHGEFWKRRRRGRVELRSRCKTCEAEAHREWRIQNREHWNEYHQRYRDDQGIAESERRARARFARRLRKNFGITLDEYDALVAQPCGLCRATEYIVLDHSHVTGEIRGPLCSTCNKALGFFGDDPARLRAAADYIEEHLNL